MMVSSYADDREMSVSTTSEIMVSRVSMLVSPLLIGATAISKKISM